MDFPSAASFSTSPPLEEKLTADAAIEPTPESSSKTRLRRMLAFIGIDMRRGEGAIAVVLFSYFFLVITAQYIARSVRDSAWVTILDADTLPFGFILVAICSYPILYLFARLVDRVPRHYLVAGTSVVFSASLVAFWWLFSFEDWNWVPVAFYVWTSISFVLIVSQFWSYTNHSLDPRQAKRLFGFIGAGGGLGGFVGGMYARAGAELIGSRTLLLHSATLQLVIATLVIINTRRNPPDEARVAGAAGLAKLEAARGGFQAIRASRMLSLIAAIMLCTVAVANIVNLQFAWAVDEVTTQLDEATALFGLVYSFNSLFGFVFHILFTARIHRRLGLGVALKVLPVMLTIGTAGLMISANVFEDPMTLFWVAALLIIGEKGIRYSFDQATRELLFLPVPSRARYRAKAYIDVFIQRFAKGVGAAVALVGTYLLGWSIVQVGWFSLAIIVIWIAATIAAKSEFVRTFRDGLRARTVDAAMPVDLSDATSLELMVQSLGSTDPRQVLRGLEMLDYHRKHNVIPPLLLYHDSHEVRLETLRLLAKGDRRDALPMIERLLSDEDPDVRAGAIQALAALRHEDATAIMAPRLRDPDPRIRAAAVASVVNHGLGESAEAAAEVLAGMASDADPKVRAYAAAALSQMAEPVYQEMLVKLLYDDDLNVVRQAISAVRERVGNGGHNPIFVPTLISLMRDRRLKHDAREALVGYGESVIPALVHFMGDPDEQIWVRRAVPKTVARIGGDAAARALLDNLDVSDLFLRRKVIEALCWLRGSQTDLPLPEDAISSEVYQEARRYFLSLTDLVSVSKRGTLAFESPLVAWQRRQPILLQQLFRDRMQNSLEAIFGMLELLYPPRDVRAAYQGLMSGEPALKAHALEYLDNTLTGDIHKAVFSVIAEDTLQRKLRLALSTYQLAVQPADDVLARLLLASYTEEEGAYWLGTAAIHAIYVAEIESLYPQVVAATKRQDDSVVKETAVWVCEKLGLAPA